MIPPIKMPPRDIKWIEDRTWLLNHYNVTISLGIPEHMVYLVSGREVVACNTQTGVITGPITLPRDSS